MEEGIKVLSGHTRGQVRGQVFTPHVKPRAQGRRGRGSDPKDRGAFELP